MRAAAVLALMLIAAHGEAKPRTIQTPPMKTGDCRWVHGRFAVYNGTPSQRIWIVGTKRIVAIGDDDSNVPAVIRAYERGGPFLGLDDSLFADFRLCALEDNRPGRMQHVHIAEVRDPRFRSQPFRPSPKEP